MVHKGKKPASLSQVIEQVVTSLGQGKKYHGWRIVSLWPQIVGEKIAGHSRAVKFSEGTLIVIVEKDVWRQELEMQREHILRRIQAMPGGKAVGKIVLRAGSILESENEQIGG